MAQIKREIVEKRIVAGCCLSCAMSLHHECSELDCFCSCAVDWKTQNEYLLANGLAEWSNTDD